MSRTWSLEYIEADMRTRPSEFLKGWLEISAGVDQALLDAGHEIPKVKPVDDIAIKILKERGDYSA